MKRNVKLFFTDEFLDGVGKGYIFILIIGSCFFFLVLTKQIKMPQIFKTKDHFIVSRTLAAMFQKKSSSKIKKDKIIIDEKNSMNYFFQKITGLEKGSYDGTVKILFYGTSDIGFDRIPGQMRERLQAKYGDGGKGLVPIAKGWKYQRHKHVKWEFSNDWQTYPVTFKKKKDGHYGILGVVSRNSINSWVSYETMPVKKSDEFESGKKFSKFRIFYRSTSDSGEVSLKIDDKKDYQFKTSKKVSVDSIHTIDLDDSPHRIKLEIKTGEVDLYAVALDRDRGIIVDTAMLVGAHVEALLNFDYDHIKNKILLRNPDLIIFQMGSNEAFSSVTTKYKETFIKNYVEGIKRIISVKPEVSCLVVSIKDLGIKYRNTVITREGVPKIVDATQTVAERAGCAFFNLFQHMGGEGVMGKWSQKKNRLVSSDYGHLFNEGAKKIGNILADLLIMEKDNYD